VLAGADRILAAALESSEPFRSCDRPFCVRQEGHGGDHIYGEVTAQIVEGRSEQRARPCSSRYGNTPRGEECSRPEGHTEWHRNSQTHRAWPSWEGALTSFPDDPTPHRHEAGGNCFPACQGWRSEGAAALPDQCPGSPACDGAGTWGATGRLPEGHTFKKVGEAAYLAHDPGRERR
jgi:hypothetical protein